MTTEERREAFRVESRALAEHMGLPIVVPSGAFIADARVAWVIEHVEDWHERSQVPRYDPGWFHASSLGYGDDVLLAEYKGTSDRWHPAGTLRVFDNGIGRDLAWKRYLRESGLSVARGRDDKRIRIEALRLTGECDDIIRKPLDADADPLVLEFKTINPYQFGQLLEPLPSHVLQVHAYMAGLSLSDAVILYESKGSQALRAFHVPFDISVWTGICIRLKRLMREAGPVEVGKIKARTTAEGKAKAAALEM